VWRIATLSRDDSLLAFHDGEFHGLGSRFRQLEDDFLTFDLGGEVKAKAGPRRRSTRSAGTSARIG
jgi:hypothetical protein